MIVPPSKTWWVVDTILWTVRESKPYMTLDMLVKRYESREDAENAIPDLIRARKEELLAEVAMLDMILDIEPCGGYQ
jgi:hypothetical protein